MSARPSIIESARASVAALLAATGLLDAESVIEHKAGNTQARFDEALAKTGLCAIVGILSAREEGSQSKTIYWAPIALFVDVVQSSLHQLADQPAPGAWAVAEELVAALKLAAIGDNMFPQISNEPLKEMDAAEEGFLVVRFTLELRADGNTRSS
jgi:hypothetical protein